jgi:hypothetical protein
MGRRFSAGLGRRRFWNNAPSETPVQYSAETESDILKANITALKTELNALEDRLSQLVKQEK